MKTRKDMFKDAFVSAGSVKTMVIAVLLPTGAKELIINNEHIVNKFEYYCSAYDDDMKLKYNNDVSILNWLFI